MDFLEKIHFRLAEISISGAALRNQGTSGIVETARKFLREIDLISFKNSLENEQNFNRFLDNHTTELINHFQKLEGFKQNEGGGFGAARKSLNLFFREVVYNKFWAEQLGLPTDLENYNRAIQHLEIPLDKDVAEGILKHRSEVKEVPEKWPRVIHLTPEISKAFQKAAQIIATQEETVRVHLDLIFWRKTPKPV